MAKNPSREEKHPIPAPAPEPEPQHAESGVAPAALQVVAADPNVGLVIPASGRSTLTRAGHRYQRKTVDLMRALGKIRY